MHKNTLFVNNYRILQGALLVSLLCLPVYAATPVPSGQTAGAEETRARKEGFYEKAAVSSVQGETDIIEAKEEPGQKEEAGSRFLVKDIRFVGNDSIPTDELHRQIEGLLNNKVSLSGLKDAAARIKKYYRDKGFIAAYVYVPPQKVKDGIVEMQVAEGKLGKVTVTGNRWFSEELIRNFIHLKEGAVLKYEDLRRKLLRFNKHRDVETKIVLDPGDAAGTTDAEIQTRDLFPFHLSTDVNNLGTKDTGLHRYGVTAMHTNLFGRTDELTTRFQAGEGSWAVLAGYVTPIHYDWGTRLGLSYSHAHVDVGGEFSALNPEGDADTYGIYFLQPVLESKNLDVTLKGGFDWKSVENRILGTVSGKDELRILNTGINFEERDDRGQTYSLHQLNFGFSGILGASDKVDEGATRTGTGGQFFAYNGSLIRYERLPKEVVLSMRGAWQVTPDSLAPSEQFHLGGANSVRGYGESEYLSDQGVNGSLEILIPTYFSEVQLVGFIDAGYGTIRDPLVGEKKSRALFGAGAGARVHLYDKVYARVEWAAPLGGSRPLDGKNYAFYFGVAVELS